MFFKLKNFRVLTLSISECKNNYKWFGGNLLDSHKQDLQNHNLIYFFNGNHFLQTNNFKQIQQENKGEYKIVPNCFKLTRWGTFKDINSAQNTVDSGTKYPCQDSEFWRNTKYACVWTHYVKEARFRLNFPAFLPNRFDNSNGRIGQYIGRTTHPEFKTLKEAFEMSEPEDRAQKEMEYDAGVFRDIMWCMFLYAVMRCQFEWLRLGLVNAGPEMYERGTFAIWQELGQIGRQIFKNMSKFDDGTNLLKGIQLKSLLRSFDDSYEDQYYEEEVQQNSSALNQTGQILTDYDEFCKMVEIFDGMMKNVHITNFEYKYWQSPGMLLQSKLFDGKF